MLCTPPAFILSQDQTLEKIISQVPKHLKPSRAIYLSFTFCLSSILNKLWRDQYCTCNALYFSLVVQFSMTIAVLLADSLTILPHHSGFVNTFFRFFLLFFKKSFKAWFLASSTLLFWGGGVSLYHFKSLMSSGFLLFLTFWSFLQKNQHYQPKN